MTQYGMDAAVAYLTQWVEGTLQLEPLLDVSAFLGAQPYTPGVPNLLLKKCLFLCETLLDVSAFLPDKPLACLGATHFFRSAITARSSSLAFAADVPQSFEPVPGILKPLSNICFWFSQ